MKALVYLSNANVEFTSEEFRELVSRAARRNAEREISGYLFFERERFVQYLEGEADVLDELLARIEADPRHEILYRAEQVNLVHRRFPHWGMRWLPREEIEEVELEHLLSDHLLLLSSVPRADWAAHVWRMVESIAERRSRLRLSRTDTEPLGASVPATAAQSVPPNCRTPRL